MRRHSIRPILSKVILLCCSVALGPVLNPIAIGQDAPTDQPVVLRSAEVRVTVVINNPKRLEYEVWDVNSKHRVLYSTNAGRRKFLVPSGKYTVRTPSNKSSLPVPAIAGALDNSDLEITIGDTVEVRGELVKIPAGPALIGDELGVSSSDEALRIEEVPSFWLGRTEVTNGQYLEFLNSESRLDRDWIDLDSRKCLIQQGDDGKFSTRFPRTPVVMVSHSGALAYCRWLSHKTGERYRLPTEIEWEKAARGPYSTVYAYGNRYDETKANQESGAISKVGRFSPSPWHLSDMTGNVFEWMQNRYDAKKPPTMNQALRGGSYVLDGMYLRNSFRMRQSPSVMTDDFGFRILKED